MFGKFSIGNLHNLSFSDFQSKRLLDAGYDSLLLGAIAGPFVVVFAAYDDVVLLLLILLLTSSRDSRSCRNIVGGNGKFVV